MKRILLFISLFAAAGCLSVFGQTNVAEEVAAAPVDHAQAALDALAANNAIVAQEQLDQLQDPVGRLYITACMQRANGDSRGAIQTIALVIAEHFDNEKWIAPSELLSAQLYMDLYMIEAAAVTARQVQILHEGTDSARQAAALSIEIDKLLKEME